MRQTIGLALAAATAGLAQTGSILGVVRDAVGGAPLGGVRVYISSDIAVTGPQGRFAFDKAAPGLQRVQASDNVRGASGGAYVLVEAGQTASAEIWLKVGGTISGRVLDEDRHPVDGAMVVLLGKRYEFGEVVYVPGKPVIADGNGKYRFEGVPAEHSFIVLAKKTLKLADSRDDPPADVAKRERVLMPAFYPDAPDPGGAEAVVLAPGEKREGVDIRMAPAPSYCIDGKVEVGEDRQPSVSVTERWAGDSGWRLAPAIARTREDGAFRACGLHPGEYRLSASQAGIEQRMFMRSEATVDVTVEENDVRDVRLMGRATASAEGEVTYDPPRPGGGRILVGLKTYLPGEGYADSTERPPSGPMAGNAGMNTLVNPPAKFRVPPQHDEWQVRVQEMPAGCYVKEAKYGEQDVRFGLLRLSRGKAGDRVEIVIGCDGGALTAQVVDRDGNPVSHVSLYLMASEADSAAAMAASLRRTEVSQGTSAPLSGLAPGKYLALATDLDLDIDPAADEIDRLWSARGRAQEVEIAPGAAVKITLTPQTIN